MSKRRDGGLDDDRAVSPPLFNIDEVEALMQARARAGESISYSDALQHLGYRFSRPKMRALCVLLAEIDRRAEAQGAPELAVLLVRESDRIPGQGWWVGRHDYVGEWEGATAKRYVEALQTQAFKYWRGR